MFETKEGLIKPIIYIGIVNKNKILLVDYMTSPNTNKSGWWIPAPGLEFGADPLSVAKKQCEDIGILIEEIKLKTTESFVLPGGWHLIWHFIIKTDSQPNPHPNIKSYKWVSASELSQIKNMAHGKWEIDVGLDFLNT